MHSRVQSGQLEAKKRARIVQAHARAISAILLEKRRMEGKIFFLDFKIKLLFRYYTKNTQAEHQATNHVEALEREFSDKNQKFSKKFRGLSQVQLGKAVLQQRVNCCS